MSTLVSLREQLNDITRDPNNRIRPLTTVDRAINSWYQMVQQDLENFIDDTNYTYTASTIAGTQEYALPSDFLTLQSVMYNNIALLPTERKKIIESDQNTTTGSPIYYYVRGGNIWLYPIPNGVWTLVIDQTKTLPTITTSVDCSAPTLLDNAIINKAAALLFKQVAKSERQIREQEYEKEINSARLSLRWDENLTYNKTGWEQTFYSPKSYGYNSYDWY